MLKDTYLADKPWQQEMGGSAVPILPQELLLSQLDTSNIDQQSCCQLGLSKTPAGFAACRIAELQARLGWKGP